MNDHTDHVKEIFDRLRTYLLEKTFGLEVFNVSRFPEEDVDSLRYVSKRSLALLLRAASSELSDPGVQGREERIYTFEVRFLVKDPAVDEQFTVSDFVALINYWIVRNRIDTQGEWVNMVLQNVTYDEPSADGKIKSASGTMEVLRVEC